MSKTNNSTTKSLAPYIIGFVLSLVMTIEAYLFVVNDVLSGRALIAAIFGFAIVQLLIQLVFFLHLGSERKPMWNLQVFLFMAVVLVILVFGTLWIMNNLNYHLMTPSETENYIMEEEAIEMPPAP